MIFKIFFLLNFWWPLVDCFLTFMGIKKSPFFVNPVAHLWLSKRANKSVPSTLAQKAKFILRPGVSKITGSHLQLLITAKTAFVLLKLDLKVKVDKEIKQVAWNKMASGEVMEWEELMKYTYEKHVLISICNARSPFTWMPKKLWKYYYFGYPLAKVKFMPLRFLSVFDWLVWDLGLLHPKRGLLFYKIRIHWPSRGFSAYRVTFIIPPFWFQLGPTMMITRGGLLLVVRQLDGRPVGCKILVIVRRMKFSTYACKWHG